MPPASRQPRRAPRSGPGVEHIHVTRDVYIGPNRRHGIEDRKGIERRILAEKKGPESRPTRKVEIRPLMQQDIGRTVPHDVLEYVKRVFREAWNTPDKSSMDGMGEWRIFGPVIDESQAGKGSRIIQLDNFGLKKRVYIVAQGSRTNHDYFIATTQRTRREDRRKYDRRSGNGLNITRSNK